MAFQAARDKYNAELQKVRGFYWSSICILFVVNSKLSPKLMAVNELRIDVYIYSVGCCALISLLRHKGCHKRNSC